MRIDLNADVGEWTGDDPARASDAALLWGTIEVPADGAPIAVVPDGVTVGCHPVPLVVVRSDLPRLGHARPGGHIRYRHMSAPEARAAPLGARASVRQARSALTLMCSVW